MKSSRVGRALGVVAVAVLALAVVSPAFSAAPVTKAQIKKIAKKQIKKLVPGMIADADNLVETKRFQLGDGQSQVILTHGPFTLTASCDLDVAGDDEAYLRISTTQDNSSFDAEDETNDLDANTPATDRDWGPVIDVTADTTDIEANVANGVAVAPDGTTLVMVSVMTAVSLPSSPNTCSFAGAHVVA